jgi:hypothetical protein
MNLAAVLELLLYRSLFEMGKLEEIRSNVLRCHPLQPFVMFSHFLF